MHEFEVWQDGIMVASAVCDDRGRALAEIMHYAMIYSQDGPVEIRGIDMEGSDWVRKVFKPLPPDEAKKLRECM